MIINFALNISYLIWTIFSNSAKKDRWLTRLEYCKNRVRDKKVDRCMQNRGS